LRHLSRSDWAIALISILIVLYNFIGITSMPFHPDESSMLHQSQDLEKLFADPSMLVWVSERTGETDQTYRLLNPPIPKYIIGLGRLLAGFDSSSVDVDWNWSATWEENEKSSALPDPSLLLGSRVATTAVLVGSLIPLIIIARKLGGNRLAIITILAFAFHSLSLLHGRRAMSEGPLIFGTSLALLGILEADKRPWLTAVGTAIAASSKLSTVVLVPVGILAILWQRKGNQPGGKFPSRDMFIFSTVVILITFLLNPILWSNPFAGIGGIWNSRVDFSIRQRETIQAVSPEQILETPTQRIAGMVGLFFFRTPQTSEVANYQEQTGPDEEAYLRNPLNTLFSGPIGGGIAFTLAILGVVASAFQLRELDWRRRRLIFLLLIGTGVQAGALLVANAIPFQRYYIPLLPFVILWMGLGLLHIPNAIKKAAQYMSGSDDKSELDHSRK
jgi:hypothetical protein